MSPDSKHYIFVYPDLAKRSGSLQSVQKWYTDITLSVNSGTLLHAIACYAPGPNEKHHNVPVQFVKAVETPIKRELGCACQTNTANDGQERCIDLPWHHLHLWGPREACKTPKENPGNNITLGRCDKAGSRT